VVGAEHPQLVGEQGLERFEEGEQLVGWAVATGGGSWRRGSGKRLLLERKVGVLWRDHRRVDACSE
jgi:hypothetical protein